MAQPAAPRAFSYSRALAPLMWALACIMVVELGIVHLLVSALWSVTAAAILSALSVATLAWIVLLTLSLKRLPVLVDEGGVTMRIGSLKSVRVPCEQVAGIRTSWPREELRQRTILDLALINYPNVMLDLDPPLAMRWRSVRAVAHRLDDPAGFVAAVRRLLEARHDG